MATRSDCDEKSLYNRKGNILTCDRFNNRVIEYTTRGEIVWTYGLGPTELTEKSIIGPIDAQRIGACTLIVGGGISISTVPEVKTPVLDNRVILVNKQGKVIWQYGQYGLTGSSCNLLNLPTHATFIPNKESCKTSIEEGDVVITDSGNNRVIRVNEQKEIVWQFPGANTTPADQLINPASAQYLRNGNYLIADRGNNRAIEVTSCNQVIRVYSANGTLGSCMFASRLCNGNTLLTDGSKSRVVELNNEDAIVWQYYTNTDPKSVPFPWPNRGLRLKDGTTIISNTYNNSVLVVNETAIVMNYYGLPLMGAFLSGSTTIGSNRGYGTFSTQVGLFCPSDSKVIGDYTGLVHP